MTKEAEVEGVGVLEFPDDTPDDVIDNTVQRVVREHAASLMAGAPAGHGPIGKSLTPSYTKNPDPYAGMSFGDKALNDLKTARDSIMGLVNAGDRAAAKALTWRPLAIGDTAKTIENVVRNWDKWSASDIPAMLNPFATRTIGNGWEELPSDKFERLLDSYTQAPTTPGGRVAEMVNSAILAGKLPGSPVPGISLPRPPPNVANPKLPSMVPDDVVALGVKHDVPVYFDDITKNPLLKRIGVFSEMLPSELGTAAGRAFQNEKALDAAKRVMGQQKPAASADIEALMQKSMQRKFSTLKDMKTKLYDKAGAELDPHGIVPTPEFNQAFADARNDLMRLPMRANKTVLRTLKEIYAQGGLHPFSVTSKLSDKLGSLIDDFYNGKNTTLGSEGVQYLARMQDALDRDIATFAGDVNKVGPTGRQAYKVADEFYQQHIAPYRAEGFRNLVRTQEPEKIWTYLTSQGGLGSRAVRMYNSLDPEGRQAVRYGLVKEAFNGSLSPKGLFSPAKFSKYLEDHAEVVNRFFKGQDLDEINGFRHLMRYVDRSGAFMENPVNGSRILLPALLGGGIYSLKIPEIAIGTGVSARLLFQTERGRDLLMKLGREAPDSKRARELVDGAIRFMTEASGVQTESGSPSALDFNDVIENLAGPGVGERPAPQQ